MKTITLQIPDYAYEVLLHDADAHGAKLKDRLEDKLVENADGVMRAAWNHCRSRRCHKCDESNFTELRAWDPKPPKECSKCGSRLTAKMDRCTTIGRDQKPLSREANAAYYRGTEAFLKRMNLMRLEDGYTIPAPPRPLRELMLDLIAIAKLKEDAIA